MEAKYNADKIEEDRTEPCLTPILTLKRGKEKLFQRY